MKRSFKSDSGKLTKISDSTFDDDDDDETDTFSDIDDSEMSSYLNNEKESQFRKIIWEHMNKEYMQGQATSRTLYTGTSEEIRESKRETDKRKRALEVKNSKAAQTAADSAGQLFTKKKLSSKINYDALKNIFDDETKQHNQVSTESCSHC